MDIYTATEQAYKNGYEKGKKDAEDEILILKQKRANIFEILDAYERGRASAWKWIPLAEQKPDRDTLVIVFFEGMRDTPAAIQIMYGWCIGGSATHWMPLPEPPKEG